MLTNPRTVIAAAVLCAIPTSLHAQFNFNVAGRQVQVHSFGSQGFGYSNQNNYLSMKTTSGSFAMTDVGANFGVKISDKFRVGAQVYDRNVGNLGNWRPSLDWLVADYRFKDWFGIRGGKVKTMLGLFNDTQDMAFLHTWALLPQSTYPIDLRGDTVAHLGADLYGNLATKKLGSFSYTLYGGKRPDDPTGGYVYSVDRNQGTTANSARQIDSYGGPIYGADLRWITPIKGVMLGSSYLNQDITTNGFFKATHIPYQRITYKDHMAVHYVEYTLGNLRLDGEYRREIKVVQAVSAATGLRNNPNATDQRMGYVSAAYRFGKRLEVGTYHSRYYTNWRAIHSLQANHIFDQVVTARVDLSNVFDLKVEGHFIDGAATNNAVRGFYPQNNPSGLQPDMRLLVIRVGFHM